MLHLCNVIPHIAPLSRIQDCVMSQLRVLFRFATPSKPAVKEEERIVPPTHHTHGLIIHRSYHHQSTILSNCWLFIYFVVKDIAQGF